MIYLFLADGFEEIEALVPIDILKRANIDIKTVGIGKSAITGTHNISINCDTTDSDLYLNDLQGIILPGGMPGALNLEKNKTVQQVIDYCYENRLLISAICAAPQILGHKGLLNGKNATCFPGFEKELIGANFINQKVVSDGNFITACGAGAAFEFGFEILKYLTNESIAEDLKRQMKFI